MTMKIIIIQESGTKSVIYRVLTLYNCTSLFSVSKYKVDTRTTREIRSISKHKSVIRSWEQQRISRPL